MSLLPVTIGHILAGKYRLLRPLGDGGMGAVYEAVHERLGTRFAIKVMHADLARRPGIVERFLQEARVSAQIKSPHVCQVIDVDQAPEGDAYMVMELLEGETLLALLDREKKLPVATAVDYGRQILEALEAAHALGVVHRDLKPENVFVTFAAGKPVLKLIDFGIAKVKREGAASLTLAGITMGTAEYMAPEQAFSAAQADARSDIYAVGVMLYEMLCGTRPVLGDDPRAIAAKVERGEVTPLVSAAPEVPPPLAGLVHRAMAPRPEMRFPTATEMRLGLEAVAQGQPVPIPAPMSFAATAKAGPPSPEISAAMSAPPASPVVPGAAALDAIPAAPTTQRGGPPIDPSAFSPPMPGMMPGPAPYAPSYPEAPPPRAGRRRRGNGIWIAVVVIPLLVGAGITVAVVSSQGDSGGGTTDTPPATATQPTASGTVAATAQASTTAGGAIDPLAPLSHTGAGQTYVAPHPVGPTAAKDAGAARPDAGTTTAPFPPFPSGFQIPSLPGADGGAFPIPSFQIPQIPGFGQPPPQH